MLKHAEMCKQMIPVHACVNRDLLLVNSPINMLDNLLKPRLLTLIYTQRRGNLSFYDKLSLHYITNHVQAQVSYSLLLFSILNSADAYTVPIVLREHIANALTLSKDAA